MNKNDKEIIQHGFRCFNFLLDMKLNYTFDDFANIIKNYSSSIQAKCIANTFKKYKGVVSKTELIIDLK